MEDRRGLLAPGLLKLASFILLFCALALTAVVASALSPGSSEEERAMTVLRRYILETSQGDPAKAFALMEPDAQRVCPLEMFKAGVEFSRDTYLRRTADVKLEGIREPEFDFEFPPDMLALIATFSLDLYGTRRELESGVLMTKASGTWKLRQPQQQCMGLLR